MRCRFLRKIRGGRPKALSFFEFICYNAVRRPQEQAAAIIKNLCPTTRQTSKAEITNKINNVPVVELDTIKASDAFGPGSSPGGHTKTQGGRKPAFLFVVCSVNEIIKEKPANFLCLAARA